MPTSNKKRKNGTTKPHRHTATILAARNVNRPAEGSKA